MAHENNKTEFFLWCCVQGLVRLTDVLIPNNFASHSRSHRFYLHNLPRSRIANGPVYIYPFCICEKQFVFTYKFKWKLASMSVID